MIQNSSAVLCACRDAMTPAKADHCSKRPRMLQDSIVVVILASAHPKTPHVIWVQSREEGGAALKQGRFSDSLHIVVNAAPEAAHTVPPQDGDFSSTWQLIGEPRPVNPPAGCRGEPARCGCGVVAVEIWAHRKINSCRSGGLLELATSPLLSEAALVARG